MKALPTPRQLTYFVTVADTLSFSKAADQCSVTQSTLSSGLRDLETLLGQSLFRRTSRSVSLTPNGQALLDPARDILQRTENLLQLVPQNRAPLSGALTLGVIPTIAPYLLPELLPHLQKSFPALDLHLREDLTARLLEDLNKGRIDAVLMAFPYEGAGLEAMPLWSEPFFLVGPQPTAANARHGKTQPAETRPAKPDDLNAGDILLLDDGHCLRDHAIAACRLRPQVLKKTFGATSLPTLIQMVQHGFGSTLLPAMAIDAGAVPFGLSVRRFVNPAPVRQIGLAWRKGSARADEFRLLGEFIEKSRQAR